MTRSAPALVRRIALGLVVVVAVARCLPILWWADVHMDADEAVVGLMAKHVADGSAFPVFQYALKYVVVLEAWLAAPLMAIADGSVVLLKAVPVTLNVATAAVLYATLTATPTLGPFAALLAVAPVALPGVTTTEDLTKAIGMNIEPLLFTLVLWLVRERPVLLGVTAAVAVKNREFALYAIAALLMVDLLRDRSAALWRGRLVALVAFLSTWSSVELLREYSSPFGPHSNVAMLATAGDNVSVAVGAMCLQPALMPGDVWKTATEFLPVLFGVVSDGRSIARVYGVPPLDAPWLWLPLVAILGVGVWRGTRRALRMGPSSMTWFGAYLILVGVQAVLVYALTRCGHVSTFTLRYSLLSLFIPAGAIALALERETHVVMRGLTIAIVTVWMGVTGLGHVTLARVLAEAHPEGTYRRLANYLEGRGVQFIVADYRIGYQVAFLSGEHIKALTNFERVRDYTLAVEANLDRAAEVRRQPNPPCEGGQVVAGFYICPPIEPSLRP